MVCAFEKETLMKVQAGTEHVVCRSIDAQAMSSICKCRARRGRPSNLGVPFLMNSLTPMNNCPGVYEGGGGGAW